jgi:hypothetical protein
MQLRLRSQRVSTPRVPCTRQFSVAFLGYSRFVVDRRSCFFKRKGVEFAEDILNSTADEISVDAREESQNFCTATTILKSAVIGTICGSPMKLIFNRRLHRFSQSEAIWARMHYRIQFVFKASIVFLASSTSFDARLWFMHSS